MEFRAFLINLFDQLSDVDRQSLHFALGTSIPRQYRDNCTPFGSLQVLDSLFDRNFITEQNFDYLINIFEQINCYNAAEQLKEYKLYTPQTSIAEPASSSSLSYLASSDFVEDDKVGSLSNDVRRQSSQFLPSSTQSSVELGHSTIRFGTFTSSEDTDTSDELNKKPLSSIMKKIFQTKSVLFSIVLVIITVLLIILCIIFIRSRKINHSTPSTIIKQEIYYILKEGLQYGNQNESFNDAKDLELSYIDRCIGVELQWSSVSLLSIRFLYSKNRSSNISIIQNQDLPVISSVFTSTFLLNSNEQINKINLYENNLNITGIQFLTTVRRKSQLFGSNNGHFLTESFEHHIFGYATGKQEMNKGIEMLQFVWIKPVLAQEQIVTVTRPMREICEFTFISFLDNQLVHVKGIESSWYDLKQKFHRQGAECHPTASYYEKISRRGPQLFAILNQTSVFYHDKGEWSIYLSAENIKCHIIPWSD